MQRANSGLCVGASQTPPRTTPSTCSRSLSARDQAVRLPNLCPSRNDTGKEVTASILGTLQCTAVHSSAVHCAGLYDHHSVTTHCSTAAGCIRPSFNHPAFTLFTASHPSTPLHALHPLHRLLLQLYPFTVSIHAGYTAGRRCAKPRPPRRGRQVPTVICLRSNNIGG